MATCTGAGADKRKAETSHGFELSQPRLRHRDSMPARRKTSECTKSFSLLDLMKKGFPDHDTVDAIVPSIVPIVPSIIPSIMHNIHPQITEAIKLTLKTSLPSTKAQAVDGAIAKFQQNALKPLMDQRERN